MVPLQTACTGSILPGLHASHGLPSAEGSTNAQATPPQLIRAPSPLPLAVDMCLIEGGSISQQDMHSPLNSWITHYLQNPSTAYWPPQGENTVSTEDKLQLHFLTECHMLIGVD